MKFNTKKYIVTTAVSKQVKEVDDDYVTKSIGAFGAWQLLFCTICVLSRMIAMWNLLSVLFLTPRTEFRCVAFEGDRIEAKNSTCYKDCKEYVYSDSVFEKSVISEFDLICGRQWQVSFVQTALTFGLFCGVWFFGWLSDRFGRSKALVLSTFANVIFMVAIPFSKDYWIFIGLRVLTGFTSGGIMTITIVFALEVVGQQYREAVGSYALLFDGLSEATLAVFAYYTNTWNNYMLSYTAVSVAIFLMLLPLPETPRWLLVNGRTEDAIKLLTKAAKFNKRPTSGIKGYVEKAHEEFKLKEQDSQKLTFRDLFRTKRLAMTTICSMVVWFITGLCFFGISQYMSMIDGNLYVLVAVMGILQLPTCPVAMVATRVFGRKYSTIGSDIVVAVSMMAFIFIPLGTLASTIIGVIGATAANVKFVVVYIYATELYPTPMRNMGFGFSSGSSKVGAMIAPFVATLRPFWMSSLIFAVLPFVAVGFCLLLPETKGKKLQDTIE